MSYILQFPMLYTRKNLITILRVMDIANSKLNVPKDYRNYVI